MRTLALLALLAGARADCANGYPKIAATYTIANQSYFSEKDVSIPYGEDVSLFCSSNDTYNLSIQRKGNNQQVMEVNTTTILLPLITPHVGLHDYFCMDSKTGCFDIVTVMVVPVISVLSPGVRRTRESYKNLATYFVPRGEIYDIFCSVNSVDSTNMSRGPLDFGFAPGPELLQTEVVNATTVRYEANANDVKEWMYSCYKKYAFDYIVVIVDYYPETKHFQCISFQWRKLECSWNSLRNKNNFELFIVDNEEKQVSICTGVSNKNSICSWDYKTETEDYTFKEFSLLMRTCNRVFCDSQTFRFERKSIMKLDPPSDLNILAKRAQSVTVAWRMPNHAYYIINDECDFKIEYRLLGMKWRQTNAMVKCYELNQACTVEITQLCPDSNYELRVYLRLKAAAEDRFWSDPTHVFFFTEPQTSDVIDPSCDEALTDPEPITSADAGISEVGKLMREVKREKSKLKQLLSSIKRKLAEVKVLENLTAEASVNSRR